MKVVYLFENMMAELKYSFFLTQAGNEKKYDMNSISLFSTL